MNDSVRETGSLSSIEKSDALAREMALQPDGSFIVQAPAGSGKTGLLVYRILRLLAISQQPESVLAITFTRKATREMRERLVGLLQRAERNEVSEDEYEQQGLDLAKAVLQQDQKHGWRLLDTPQRIQIQTIDALSLRLVSAMPWLSRLGAQPAASDDSQALYEAAIEQFLVDELLSEQSDPQVQWLLTELDFNYRRISNLFSAMLAKRDQWLRHLLSHSMQELKPKLKRAWQVLATNYVEQLMEACDDGLIARFETFVDYAYPNIIAADKLPEDLVDLAPPQLGASSDQSTAVFWRMVSHLLFTGQGTLRKALNKNTGFPTDNKAIKTEMLSLIAELEDDEALLEQLLAFNQVPLRPFTDGDVEQLENLDYVLKKLAAYLQLQFRSRGKSDHSEVTQRANLALQELDDPTELGLKLDYQINHILVDEFQDTSFSQIGLLQRLMLGWSSEVDQGAKTLFLVGDPMQSIYRFREADVGLFLDVWNNAKTGVFPDQRIQPLTLSRNFRSSGSMVAWFNSTFFEVLPEQDNSLTGAVRYAPASTHRAADDPACVNYLLAQSAEEEAQSVLNAVEHSLRLDPNGSVAILVRSRRHLESILPLLETAGIAYQGLNLAPLSVEPAVSDVVHLTRALAKLDDRIAWLALLRGPWVGLSLATIQTVCAGSADLVFEQLQHFDTQSCSSEEVQRIQRFTRIMRRALAQRQLVDLDTIVRWAWHELGGAETRFGLSNASIEVVFNLIAEHQKAGELSSLNKLEKSLEEVFAVPDINDQMAPRVTITTIHKSKGLEFDTVILPSLSKPARADSKDLLMWTEWQAKGRTAEMHLLLAPYSINDEGPHYKYLRYLEGERSANERSRLLYVAATRAVKKLVLTAQLDADAETGLPKSPTKSSLLAELWPSLEEQFEYSKQAQHSVDQEVAAQANAQVALLQRLPVDYELAVREDISWRSSIPPMTRQVIQDDESNDEAETELEFAWAGDVAIVVGNLIHQWFEQLSLDEIDALPEEPDFNFPLLIAWRAKLKAAQLDDPQFQYAMRRLLKAVTQVRQDPNARFVFAQRSSTKTELGVAAYLDGAVRNFTIDRMFEHEGELWIIDHKTTDTREPDIEQFAITQVEERHRKQLELYGSLMAKIDSRPINLGVYFPLLKQLRSWSYSPAT